MLKIIFALCFAAVLSVSIFGQTVDLDLKKTFNKYALVKINNQAAVRKAKTGAAFRISTVDKNFQFILRLHDMRAPDYRAEYTDNTGSHSLPPGEAFTYQATLIGEPDSIVALTIDGTKVEGYLATATGEYFMEAAKKYSASAGDDDKIIYQSKDRVKQDDGAIDSVVAAGVQNSKPSAEMNTATPILNDHRVLFVATEADKDFVADRNGGNGSVVTANNTILSVMNLVDADFERQLHIRIAVSFQNAWATNSIDPYAGYQNTPLLEAFQNYWELHFPRDDQRYHRDLAHLFTTKFTPGEKGLGYPSVVCGQPDYAYGFSSTVNPTLFWNVTAHELGHNLGADHSDKATPAQPNCEGTIMQSLINQSAAAFCAYSINQIRDYLNSVGNCLMLDSPPVSKALFDFDGDGYADIGVFRPSDTNWYLQESSAGFYAMQFGTATDKVVPADYDGDGKTDIAVFRPSNGTWYIQRSSLGFIGVQFGQSGDIPVPGDFTGDGKAEIAVFRPSNATWYTFNLTNNQTTAFQFGSTGDKPLIGDFDGDHKNDYAVYTPSNSTFYIWRSGNQSLTYQTLGSVGDIPVPADYDGDGRADYAIFHPATRTWRFAPSSSTHMPDVTFGQSGDIPTPADYDGDGSADISVFRPSDGTWNRINSLSGALVTVQFGQSGDIPLPAFNIVQ